MLAVVLGLLGGHMAFIFTAIALGTGDPSFAVVPNYYQKAVDYDERKVLLAESDALGWSTELIPGTAADASGQRDLVVQIKDEKGGAVRGLTVQIDAYHLARASDPVRLVCVEALPGQYIGKARMTKEGFWQFAVDASLGEKRFIAESKQFVLGLEGAR